MCGRPCGEEQRRDPCNRKDRAVSRRCKTLKTIAFVSDNLAVKLRAKAA